MKTHEKVGTKSVELTLHFEVVFRAGEEKVLSSCYGINFIRTCPLQHKNLISTVSGKMR